MSEAAAALCNSPLQKVTMLALQSWQSQLRITLPDALVSCCKSTVQCKGLGGMKVCAVRAQLQKVRA